MRFIFYNYSILRTKIWLHSLMLLILWLIWSKFYRYLFIEIFLNFSCGSESTADKRSSKINNCGYLVSLNNWNSLFLYLRGNSSFSNFSLVFSLNLSISDFNPAFSKSYLLYYNLHYLNQKQCCFYCIRK